MARYTGPACRLCRREGISICGHKKCAATARPYAPGQHGAGKRTKLSNYGIQLREKQKVKRLYGLLEKQFRLYYEKAAVSKGVTGTVLLQLLETRLDNVIYRSGFATSRPQGRQIVSHGMVFVNNRKVNIASYHVQQGDEVEVRVKDKSKKFIESNIECSKDRTIPEWLKIDNKNFKGKIERLPVREDIVFPIKEQLIVELYSK
ncbi:MAG: 30S ribosomal protein S4 [Candidatus Omnitrophica bacterium]|nr:30S ribosomal protein S4 [Candidatus Omnitrophota bacterium]